MATPNRGEGWLCGHLYHCPIKLEVVVQLAELDRGLRGPPLQVRGSHATTLIDQRWLCGLPNRAEVALWPSLQGRPC